MDFSDIFEYLDEHPLEEEEAIAVTKTDRVENGEEVWVVDLEVWGQRRNAWDKINPLDVD